MFKNWLCRDIVFNGFILNNEKIDQYFEKINFTKDIAQQNFDDIMILIKINSTYFISEFDYTNENPIEKELLNKFFEENLSSIYSRNMFRNDINNKSFSDDNISRQFFVKDIFFDTYKKKSNYSNMNFKMIVVKYENKSSFNLDKIKINNLYNSNRLNVDKIFQNLITNIQYNSINNPFFLKILNFECFSKIMNLDELCLIKLMTKKIYDSIEIKKINSVDQNKFFFVHRNDLIKIIMNTKIFKIEITDIDSSMISSNKMPNLVLIEKFNTKINEILDKSYTLNEVKRLHLIEFTDVSSLNCQLENTDKKWNILIDEKVKNDILIYNCSNHLEKIAFLNNNNNSNLSSEIKNFNFKSRILQSSCKVTNCDICQNRNSITCNNCKGGYYLANSNKTCSPCSNGCSNCINESNQTLASCILCKSGFFLQKNSIIGNNNPFFSNATNIKNDTQICTPCLSNCKICINGQTCLTCNDYFQIDSSLKKCISCIENNCNNCDIYGKCIKCLSGFYLNYNNLCSQCKMDDCLTCDSEGKCAVCTNGFYLDKTTFQCIPCSSFDQYCQTCSGQDYCKGCTSDAYLELNFDSGFAKSSCKKCDVGKYLGAGEKKCSLCSDFGKCGECTKLGCSQCVSGASPDEFRYCKCNGGYISIGENCLSVLVIILPVVATIIVIGIISYCIIRRKRLINPVAERINIVNANPGRINNPNNVNNINNLRNVNVRNDNNNRRNIRVAMENRLLKALIQHNVLHGVKCIFGDESPPFWEFDCGGYMCNPCSLKFVTNFTNEKANCPKCKNLFNNFKFVNRYLENEDIININSTSLIRIDGIKGDSLNNSLNDTQNDYICKICFVLKNSKQIKCDSNTPHMVCSYCYNRLINIEEIEHCPFCRSDIHH